MIDNNSRNINRRIRDIVHKIDSTANVILYGSRARGNATAESDWDILILTDSAADLSTEQTFREGLYDLELETGQPISVFVYSKEDWQTIQHITPFYEQVQKEGIIL